MTASGISSMTLNVALLVDATSQLAGQDSPEYFLFGSEAVEAIDAALSRLGHRPRRLSFDMGVSRMVALLSSDPVDVVFLLGQPEATDPAGEAKVAALLDLLQIAHTSESTEALMLATDKARAKAICAHYGLPTPPYAVAINGELPFTLPPGPWIAKPTLEDGSRGITCEAPASDRAQLAERVRSLYTRFAEPVLIETFVGGREFRVGIIGSDLLPIAEVDFSRLPEHCPHVAGYESKWKYDSVEFKNLHYLCPAPVDAALGDRLRNLSHRTAAAFGLQRCSRLDIRMDDKGELHILDVNANPDLSPVAIMHEMARVAGFGYDGLVQRLLDLARTGRRMGTSDRSERTTEHTVGLSQSMTHG